MGTSFVGGDLTLTFGIKNLESAEDTRSCDVCCCSHLPDARLGLTPQLAVTGSPTTWPSYKGCRTWLRSCATSWTRQQTYSNVGRKHPRLQASASVPLPAPQRDVGSGGTPCGLRTCLQVRCGLRAPGCHVGRREGQPAAGEASPGRGCSGGAGPTRS